MKYLLIKYLLAIKKRIWMLALIVVFAVCTSYGLTKYTVVPEYKATAKLVINLKTTATPELMFNEVMAYSKLEKTYNEIIKSTAVAQQVIDKMQLHMTPEALAAAVSVSSLNDSQIIAVSVASSDPKLVGQLADEVSLAFMDKVAHMMQVDNVIILDKASGSPVSKTAPNTKMNLLMAFTLSALVGVGVLALREYLDPTLKMREEVNLVLRLALVGEIGIWEQEKKKRGAQNSGAQLQMLPSKQNRAVLENYNTLYRNLIPLNILHELKTILFTSTVRSEGRSTILTHFGVLLAQSGQRVLLIDADFENPALHVTFQMPAPRGLCEVLTGWCRLEDAAVETRVNGLYVLPTGAVTQEAVRMLGKAPFTELLERVREEFDIVLIDSSAMEESMVPQAIAPKVDGTLFVVGSSIVERNHAALAVDVLRVTQGVNMLGAVLNNLEGKTKRPKFFLERKKKFALPDTEAIKETT